MISKSSYYIMSLCRDYYIVKDAFASFVRQVIKRETPYTEETENVIRWYHSLLSKINSMIAELSSCQQ